MKKHHPFEEELPKELESRILRSAAPQLFALRGNASVGGYRARAFALLLAGGLCAGAIIMLARKNYNGPPSPTGVAALEPELLENFELLKNLELLRNAELLERAKGGAWPKKKS